jgi:hypothetical protein
LCGEQQGRRLCGEQQGHRLYGEQQGHPYTVLRVLFAHRD